MVGTVASIFIATFSMAKIGFPGPSNSRPHFFSARNAQDQFTGEAGELDLLTDYYRSSDHLGAAKHQLRAGAELNVRRELYPLAI